MAGLPPFAWEPDKGTHIAFIPRKGTVADMKWVSAPALLRLPSDEPLRDGGRQGRGRRHEVRHSAALPQAGRLARVEDTLPLAKLFRWTFDFDGHGNTFREERLDDRSGEFPRFDERFCMSDYRHGWIVAGDITNPRTGEPRQDGLVHYDLKSGKSTGWNAGKDDRFGEPMLCRGRRMPPRATAGC